MAERTPRTDMPQRPAAERATTFDEVALGYTPELAALEASRCLGCKNAACRAGCPVGVDIPAFIAALKGGDVAKAGEIIAHDNSLPAVCGRVCPQEEQCEKRCVVGIKSQPVAIGRLERYVADALGGQEKPCDQKPDEQAPAVAVIGSGPASLACAGELVRRGLRVTVFEALHATGGVLRYGIPAFRLPKDIVDREVHTLAERGVEFCTNAIVGKSLTVDDLFARGYRAVFVGSGAGLPIFLDIPGEHLNNVFSANEYLTRINLMEAYREDAKTPVYRAKKVAVIGGGNVAMDAARCARRLGAQVDLVYRRTREEMPARAEEIEHAIEEGVNLLPLYAPIEVLGQQAVEGLRCQRMELGPPDASGRRAPVPREGDYADIDCDAVIVAVGTRPNPLLQMTTPGLDVDGRGCLVVHEEAMTTRDKVWAGGDAVTGAATVIQAMGAGRAAAVSIANALSGKEPK